ncbi:MAG TPA: hypothetical protein VJI68_01535 [Candidatus Nanoarchaeia archaeon]|nr:hypothetical protein [Candidatus Nanoarchaeia archaeon]
MGFFGNLFGKKREELQDTFLDVVKILNYIAKLKKKRKSRYPGIPVNLTIKEAEVFVSVSPKSQGYYVSRHFSALGFKPKYKYEGNISFSFDINKVQNLSKNKNIDMALFLLEGVFIIDNGTTFSLKYVPTPILDKITGNSAMLTLSFSIKFEDEWGPAIVLQELLSKTLKLQSTL